MNNLSKLIKTAKGERSVADFAKICGVAPSTLYRLINGDVRKCRAELIEVIAANAENSVTYEDLVLANTGFTVDELEKERDVVVRKASEVIVKNLEEEFLVDEDDNRTFHIFDNLYIDADRVYMTADYDSERTDAYFFFSYGSNLPDTLDVFAKLHLLSELVERRVMTAHVVCVDKKVYKRVVDIARQTLASKYIKFAYVNLKKKTVEEERVA